MYDFSELVKNSGSVAKREADKTLALGLPVTGWDPKLKKIIKRYPDGRVEILTNSRKHHE
ncbi:hypothetical protein L1D34_11100 [Vibrio mediterranei]|uniref:hypothetical protein n=1 Tax=Vibrio mediterranei TaxID=689 RepID=UPI00148C05D9|nr:hypothetical protein [Vibrio mediterranei]MCG9625391.1 hypothetical protein [Vibrio mediterranei]NOI26471.1 hypothetical protein [Vibrio mediterranei]